MRIFGVVLLGLLGHDVLLSVRVGDDRDAPPKPKLRIPLSDRRTKNRLANSIAALPKENPKKKNVVDKAKDKLVKKLTKKELAKKDKQFERDRKKDRDRNLPTATQSKPSKILSPTAGAKNASSKSVNSSAQDVCCACPSMHVATVERVMVEFAEALNAAVPGKWYLRDGSLLGALRYGTMIKRLKSGKVNLVDTDMDVGVIIPKDQEKEVKKSILKALGPGYTYEPRATFMSNVSYPVGCGAGDPNPYESEKLHLQLFFTWESYKNGSLVLTPDSTKLGADTWYPDFKGITLLSLPQFMFPLQKAKWASVEAGVPNHYLAYAALSNNQEYGSNGQYKTLWQPHYLLPDTTWCTDTKCPVDKKVHEEVSRSIIDLHKDGYASFYEVLSPALGGPANESRDVELIKAFQKKHPVKADDNR